MAGVPASAFKRLLKTGEHSDFVVVCGGTEFKVHKAIITPASQYFQIVCRNDFKEKSEARVEFQDSRPDVMTRVLEFLYTGEYSVDVPQPLQTTALPSDTASIEAVSPADPSHKDAEDMDRRMDNLKTHTLVYQLADMLGIKNLKDSVADSFRAIFDYDVITHSKFGELLDSVFTNTPRNDNNLRSRVMIHCVIRNDLIKHGGIPEGILKTHEPLAWLTGVAMQRHHEKSRAKMNALDVTVAELRGSRESQAS